MSENTETLSDGFSEILERLVFNPTTPKGRGFLGPLARTTGHFLYLLGRTADTITRRPTENQITLELDSLGEHLADFVIPEYMSIATKDYVNNLLDGVNYLREHFLDWDEENRINNLRALSNRIVYLHTLLDREILGMRNSDAGQSL